MVLKTSTRQTIFLPIAGLVDAEKLKPGDLVGVNKDSYLILDTLPAEYDSRVKAMEVRTPTSPRCPAALFAPGAQSCLVPFLSLTYVARLLQLQLCPRDDLFFLWKFECSRKCRCTIRCSHFSVAYSLQALLPPAAHVPHAVIVRCITVRHVPHVS